MSGKLLEMKSDVCARQREATDTLASNMMRYSVSYELVHGFRRPSSRARLGGPRAMFFAPDVPSSHMAPAWVSYKLF